MNLFGLFALPITASQQAFRGFEVEITISNDVSASFALTYEVSDWGGIYVKKSEEFFCYQNFSQCIL